MTKTYRRATRKELDDRRKFQRDIAKLDPARIAEQAQGIFYSASALLENMSPAAVEAFAAKLEADDTLPSNVQQAFMDFVSELRKQSDADLAADAAEQEAEAATTH